MYIQKNSEVGERERSACCAIPPADVLLDESLADELLPRNWLHFPSFSRIVAIRKQGTLEKVKDCSELFIAAKLLFLFCEKHTSSQLGQRPSTDHLLWIASMDGLTWQEQ
jgi:hypothetical protein